MAARRKARRRRDRLMEIGRDLAKSDEGLLRKLTTDLDRAETEWKNSGDYQWRWGLLFVAVRELRCTREQK